MYIFLLGFDLIACCPDSIISCRSTIYVHSMLSIVFMVVYIYIYVYI